MNIPGTFRRPWRKVFYNGGKERRVIWDLFRKNNTSENNVQTSYNRLVYAAPPVGGLGFRSARFMVSMKPFPRLPSTHNLGRGHLLRKVLLPAQIVVYNRDVMRNARKIVKIYLF